MHVLYLTTELPFPPVSGGQVRTAADLRLLQSLEEVRSIDLVCVEEESSPRGEEGARALAAVRAGTLPSSSKLRDDSSSE